jgi:hypothetical protein
VRGVDMKIGEIIDKIFKPRNEKEAVQEKLLREVSKRLIDLFSKMDDGSLGLVYIFLLTELLKRGMFPKEIAQSPEKIVKVKKEIEKELTYIG